MSAVTPEIWKVEVILSQQKDTTLDWETRTTEQNWMSWVVDEGSLPLQPIAIEGSNDAVILKARLEGDQKPEQSKMRSHLVVAPNISSKKDTAPGLCFGYAIYERGEETFVKMQEDHKPGLSWDDEGHVVWPVTVGEGEKVLPFYM